MKGCFVIGVLILIPIAFAIALYMAGTYRYVTKRMNVEMSFHDFCRLYRRLRM